MSTDIVKKVDDKVANFVDQATDIWKERDEIRKIFAPTLTDQEFKFYVAMGITLKANPFLKEIYAVKFGKGDKAQPAQIIVARDLYRRKAQELENYQGHVCDAVYPGEDFELIRDDKDRIISVKHMPNFETRYGQDDILPYGAYCVVYKSDTSIPFYVFTPFREYEMTNAKKEWVNGQATGNKVKNDFWQNKPETMIKKVAEGQALRGAFQGTFGGTYTSDEFELNPDLAVEPEPVKMPTKKIETKIPPFKKMIQAIADGKAKEVYNNLDKYEWEDEQKAELLRLIVEAAPELGSDNIWETPEQFAEELEMLRAVFTENHEAMEKKGLADFNTLMKFFAVEAKALSLSPEKMREIETFIKGA